MDKLYTDNEIEVILRSYPRLKSQSAIEEEQLFGLFPSMTASYEGMPHGSGISNQTANLGVKRASIPTTSRQVRAIELAYNALNEDCKDLIKKYYYERQRRTDVMCNMKISRDQFSRYRRKALDEFNIILSTTRQLPANFAIQA
jgi:DNA-directed RNA polymerase specialized sigma subunit